MKLSHLTVYFDIQWHMRDGRGHCVDVDLPDNSDGTRAGGNDGTRFSSPAEAGRFVADWLVEQIS
jgi:hypothetical protein